MANLKELRLRIGSVKNTRKITSAMAQIATARLRRAQNAALAARPYGERLQEVVSHLIGGIDPAERSSAHPLLEERTTEEGEKHTLYIAMTADKGLCGGFNGNINRHLLATLRSEREAGRKASLITIGAKGSGFFSRDEGLLHKHAAPTLDTIVELSKAIAAEATGGFLGTAEGASKDDRPDRVVLVYNHFVSVLTQEVTELQLCPLLPAQSEDGSGDGDDGVTAFHREPVFEPGRGEILEHLVPVAIESMLQQAMFNSVAAEIAARRVAMDAATDNASELIADLTLEYNRERQAAITSELMEIIGGAEALKG